MSLTRRNMLKMILAGASASVLTTPIISHADKPAFKAVAFDAFPIFDPRPVFELVEQLFPGKGKDFSNAWRTRQFEYQWLRALSGQYVDFWQATQDALVFAARQLKLDMTDQQRTQLMDAYLHLKPWPDVIPALKTLRDANIKLIFLSNMTPAMLNTNISHSGLKKYFHHVVSTDSARTYKPDPRAYQLGLDTLGLPKQEIVFAAFAGWDVAGAKWFGYPTFWVNRIGFPLEELSVKPDGKGNDLNQLVEFILT